MERVERVEGRGDAILPDDIRAEVDQARAKHLEALRLAHEAGRMWREVAHRVADAGLSLEDAARLMGISPARVQDLLEPD